MLSKEEKERINNELSIEMLRNTDISTIEAAENVDLFTYSRAVKAVLSILDNSISKDKIIKQKKEYDKELEEKYNADKISVFSGNTYMEKFRLLGKSKALGDLLRNK